MKRKKWYTLKEGDLIYSKKSGVIRMCLKGTGNGSVVLKKLHKSIKDTTTYASCDRKLFDCIDLGDSTSFIKYLLMFGCFPVYMYPKGTFDVCINDEIFEVEVKDDNRK